MTRYFAIVTSNHVFIAESGAVVPASQANASTRGVASRVRAFRSTTLGAEIVRRPRPAADDHRVSARPAGYGLGHGDNRTPVLARCLNQVGFGYDRADPPSSGRWSGLPADVSGA